MTHQKQPDRANHTLARAIKLVPYSQRERYTREWHAELGTIKHTAQRLGVSKDTVRKVVRGE